jgi:hypothetical protein
MMLFSKRSLQLIHLLIDWAFFLKIVPFHRRRYQGIDVMPLRIEIPELKSQFVQYLFLFYQVLLTFRFCQSISSQNMSVTYYMLELIYYTQCLLASAILLSFMVNEREWMVFVNQCFQFYTNIESK